MQPMFDQYIEASCGFIVVYSIEDPTSLVIAEKILDKIYVIKQRKDFRVVLVGNKIDSQNRVVSAKEGSIVSDKYKVKFFETSCFSGENIQVAFRNLVILAG
jgi:GTPase SAR1 family protein